MFVRGGVYRAVKQSLGGSLAKFSVSALMFDYILTGPISGVSAGQYIVGLITELMQYFHISGLSTSTRASISRPRFSLSSDGLFLVGEHQGNARNPAKKQCRS